MFRQRRVSQIFERVLSPIRRSFSLDLGSDTNSVEEIQFEQKISMDGVISKSLSEPLLSDSDMYSCLGFDFEEEDETSSESEDDCSNYDVTDSEDEILPETEVMMFSEDPAIRAVEATELADDLLEEAFELVEKHMDVLDDFHLENLESLEERLCRTKEVMSLKEDDHPATRLLKARIYLNEAEGFLTRVNLLIEMSEALADELGSN